jgi:hypothetical protein
VFALANAVGPELAFSVGLVLAFSVGLVLAIWAAVLTFAVRDACSVEDSITVAPALSAESPGFRRALSHSAQSPVFQPDFSWLHTY